MGLKKANVFVYGVRISTHMYLFKVESCFYEISGGLIVPFAMNCCTAGVSDKNQAF